MPDRAGINGSDYCFFLRAVFRKENKKTVKLHIFTAKMLVDSLKQYGIMIRSEE